MDHKAFDDCVKKLQKVNRVVAKLDPAIRSQAFALLVSYLHDRHESERKPAEALAVADAESFFGNLTGKKPADNALAAAAFLYSQYGLEPFSSTDIKKIADEVGLTVPHRPDMTFKGARRNGKSLFRRVGEGEYKPTVHGESYFKSTFGVRKGTKRRPPSEQT